MIVIVTFRFERKVSHLFFRNIIMDNAIRSKQMVDAQEKQPAHYPDIPRIAVGAFVFKDNRILLVRRGLPPAKGLWAIPGGKVKLRGSL